jgi:hypothetical protein
MKKSQSFSHLNTDQIQNLLHCMAVCKSCAKMCIEEGHKKTASLCHECADVCDLAIKLKCCESQFADKILDLCSQMCKKCAEECERMHAQHCKECAEVCRDCSNTCSKTHSSK